MRAIAADPVHVATMNGHPVRFFASPLEGPDLPWHAMADLHAALGLPQAVRDDLAARTHRRWRDHVRAADTEAERVTIAPHFMAQGLAEAFAEFAPPGVDLVREYAAAATAAVDAMLAGLTPKERLRYVLQAAGRNVAGAGVPAEETP